MSPQPRRIPSRQWKIDDAFMQSLEPECQAAARNPFPRNQQAAARQAKSEFEVDMVAESYRAIGVPVRRALLIDAKGGTLDAGYCVPLETYASLHGRHETLRVLAAGAKGLRRAMWGAAVTAAIGWSSFAIYFLWRNY